MWFDSLTGFVEENALQVQRKLNIENSDMTSIANGRTMTWGSFDVLSLAELRTLGAAALDRGQGRLRFSEVVADVQRLHTDARAAGSLFQVASQFNMLEMVAPHITPEDGVDRYQTDRTQGPACAIACGAGTIYRNYFVPLEGQIGQTRDRQIDGLRDLGQQWGNTDGRLWKMQNGYALASKRGLQEINDRLVAATPEQRDQYRQLLRIGIQSNSEVTLCGMKDRQLVSQAYCSALPISYSPYAKELWCEFAKLVLEAAYEATFWAALQNRRQTGSNLLFLTMLGGGAFGNNNEWILSAIKRSLKIFSDTNLDVAIVSFGSSKTDVRQLATDYRG